VRLVCHQVAAWAAWAEWITKDPQHRVTGGPSPAPLLRKVGAGLSSQPKKRLAGSLFHHPASLCPLLYQISHRRSSVVSHSIKGFSDPLPSRSGWRRPRWRPQVHARARADHPTAFRHPGACGPPGIRRSAPPFLPFLGGGAAATEVRPFRAARPRGSRKSDRR
jgi:hypothetical protein